MSDSDGFVPLTGAVQRLREELSVAIAAARGEELQFALGPIELEFQVGVTNEGGGEAGIKFWVVTLGAKGSHSREVTHTVKLTLTPKLVGQPTGDVNIGASGRLGG